MGEAVAVVSRGGEAGSFAPDGMVRASYRPHLDGLRAVAVYLVVAFHAGSGGLSGGFIGVDVFFVLSGYLVTQLLLRDLAAGGSIRFSRFYARRFRRLLPAAFVALLATAAVFTVIASPSELVGVSGAFRAAFLYSTNWYFVHGSANYFGAGVATNPVLPFWSLAVEEQFYLLWPLVLGGLFALTRRFGDRQRRAVWLVVGVALVMSALRALSLRTSDPNWAYYGTDARAYQLLAGASIALVSSLVFSSRYRRLLRIATAASFFALLVLASSWIHLDAIERGMFVAISASVLIAAIEGVEGGVIKRFLSSKPVVYLGKISYGTYLWHWIVILVLAEKFDLGTNATVAVACVIATGLASLSYQLLEQPVRESKVFDRHRLVVIASGLTISVVSAVVLIPAILDRRDTSPPVAIGATVGFTPVPKGINWRTEFDQDRKEGGPFTNCLAKPVEACTIVRGTGKHILLMGDSHAWMLIPTFTAIARKDHLTLSVSVSGLCPWQRGIYIASYPNLFGGTTDPRACAAQKDDLYTRVVKALHPDLVVVTQAGYEYGIEQWADAAGHPHPYNPTQVASATTASVTQLLASAARVLIIERIPEVDSRGIPFDPLQCLAKAKVIEQCRYIASRTTSPLELLYRKLAAQNPRVSDLNIDRLVCPFFPICDPIIHGNIVKWDPGHLTAAFARYIAPAIEDDLKQRGLLPR